MAGADVDAGPLSLESGFSTTKKGVLLTLKREGSASLAEIAKALGISKMAALKHLNVLEDKGLVERSYRSGGRGRPSAVFRLTSASARLFPGAYTQMTVAALRFIEERLGRDAVEDLLEARTREVHERHKMDFSGKDLRERVRTLAKIRDDDGYMAEVGPEKRDAFELLEHNCPIAAIAGEYGEACEVEQKLFRKFLRTDVDATHRVVAGATVCRFLIQKKDRR